MMSERPRCPLYPEVMFVPLIGPHPHDKQFGWIGWSCPWICEYLRNEWEKKVREEPSYEYVDPDCGFGKIMFLRTVKDDENE